MDFNKTQPKCDAIQQRSEFEESRAETFFFFFFFWGGGGAYNRNMECPIVIYVSTTDTDSLLSKWWCVPDFHEPLAKLLYYIKENPKHNFLCLQ